MKRDLTNSPEPAQAVQGRPKPSASKNKTKPKSSTGLSIAKPSFPDIAFSVEYSHEV
jgi:hypothetical protein